LLFAGRLNGLVPLNAKRGIVAIDPDGFDSEFPDPLFDEFVRLALEEKEGGALISQVLIQLLQGVVQKPKPRFATVVVRLGLPGI